MNNLSWLLYLADVASGAGHVLLLLCMITFLGGVGTTIAYFVTRHEAATYYKEEHREGYAGLAKSFRNWSFVLIPSLILCLLLSVALPSKQTLYLIALSEAGQRVATSEAVVGTVSEANELLKAYLAKMKKELLP